jgi:hypothetical protein
MANGILVGFRENEIYFSEPYVPHAWPVIYSLTVEYPVVGLGAFGESVVVATKGNPFIISGTTPSSMSQAKIPLFEPCVSKRSIVSDDTGVMYASPNGVVKISQGFAGVTTNGLFTRDEWQLRYPSTMLGAVLDGAYYLFWEDQINDVQECLILDRNEAASALTTTNIYTTAVFIDPTSAQLFIAYTGVVCGWESDPLNFLTYDWTSKLYILPRPVNFSAIQIDAAFEDNALLGALQDEVDAIIASNQTVFASGVNLLSTLGSVEIGKIVLGGSILQKIPGVVSSLSLQVKIYCNGILVSTISVTDRSTYRLPSGFKSDRWQFKLSGNVPLRAFKIAETAKELAQL